MNNLFTVEVTYLGEIHIKNTCSIEKATNWAEEAVYDFGAEYSCVKYPNGSIYCEYEM